MANYSSLQEISSSETGTEAEEGSKPGICVIINNNSPDGRKDEDWQRLLFTTLGFDVRVYRNQTVNEILSQMKSYNEEEHEGAFILSIISAGDLSKIQCSDSGRILIRDLKSHVNSIQAKIPKVLILDIFQSNEAPVIAPAPYYRRNDSVENTLTITTVTLTDNSKLTTVMTNEISHSNKDQDLSQIAEIVAQKVHGHQQHIEITDTLQNPYYIKCGTSCLEYQEQYQKFREATSQWIPMRERTLEQLDDTIEKLIEHRRNVNIARISGASASIGGATVAIIGFGLAPFTLGGSLVLSIGGIAAATAGGITAAGASIVDMVIQKSNVNESQAMLNEDHEAVKPLLQLAGEMSRIIDEMENRCPGIDNTTVAGFFTGLIAHTAVRGGNIAVKATELAFTGILELGALALRVGGIAARAVAVVGLVLNVLLVPIDVVEIVRAGINIHKGNESDAVIKLKKLKKDLEKQKISIHKIAYPEIYEE